MPKATYDLFDAPLGDMPLDDAYSSYQSLPDDMRFKIYRQEFSIDPAKWALHQPPEWVFELQWREYRYADMKEREDLESEIPENEPGIYFFYARPNRPVYKFPQFAFYIGIANEHGSGRPLRERLKQYVPAALSTITKRKNVHRMLQLYYGQIWVAYALTSKSSSELEQVEEQLHGFMHPCFGRRDFPADIKNQQKAYGEI